MPWFNLGLVISTSNLKPITEYGPWEGPHALIRCEQLYIIPIIVTYEVSLSLRLLSHGEAIVGFGMGCVKNIL